MPVAGRGRPRSLGGEHHGHAAAFALERDFNFGGVGDLFGDAPQEFLADVEVGQFTAAEDDGDEDFVAFAEERAGVFQPVVDVVRSGLGVQADFLDVGDV